MEKLIAFYREMDFKSHLSKLDTSEYDAEQNNKKEEILYNTPVEVKYDGCIFNVSLKTLFKEIGRRQEKDEMHWGNNGYGIPALFVVKK